MAYKITVDTGGTFTDVVISDETGILALDKSLTTHGRIFEGMKSAIEHGAKKLGMSLADLLGQTAILIYGTTRATNAIVTRRTAKTAFVTTEGFPDTLVFREGGKYRPHDFSMDYPEPYVPRRLTFEIPERITSEGDVKKPLDKAAAVQAIERMKAVGIEAVGVCFLWSVLNPESELTMGKLLAQHMPEVPVTLSHQLLPIIREYRRASATVIDASLKPLMQRHLAEMESDLRAHGFEGELLVSTSMGGCMHVDDVITRPVNLVKSGPAMAPVAGKTYSSAEQSGGDVVVCDTGGTTFDVGLVRDGHVVSTRESWIGARWTGHIVSMSSVDIRSIGAGGGSIAWIDEGGLLRVGPQSAGSEPGPACYGKGGDKPTVTDAALVLGYIDPEYFLGGRMKLDVEASKRVIHRLATEMSVSDDDAAFSVMALANEHMIRAIEEIAVFEGIDTQDSVMVAGGGAAGLNIDPIARELRCSTVIVPKTASALSACGMQFANIVGEYASSQPTISNRFDYVGVNKVLANLKAEMDAFAARIGKRGLSKARYEYYVEARYLFQVWELEVPLSIEQFEDPASVEALVESFHEAHRRIFAVVDESSPVECLNWKARVVIPVAEPNLPKVEHSAGAAEPVSRRSVFFGNNDRTQAEIYHGHDLKPGSKLRGPAVIEEPTTTIVVYPGSSAFVSASDNYVIKPNLAGE